MKLRGVSPYSVALAFACGALAVLVFHQGAIQMLFKSGIIPNGPYQMRAVGPLGVPAVMNAAFWGGMWALLYAALRHRFPQNLHPLPMGFVFGFLGPTLFGWFVMSAIRGTPMAAGFVLENMARGVFINGMFGVGIAAMFMLADRYLPRAP
jgi:hypothetical protein